MRTFTSTILFLLFSVLILSAQNVKPDKGNKYPRFIELESKPGKGQVNQVFKDYFLLKDQDRLTLQNSISDDLGFVHETYQQYYNNVKVEGGVYKAHIKNTQVLRMSGVFIDIFEDLNTEASISSEVALRSAKGHAPAKEYLSEEFLEMVIIGDPDGKNSPRLAYKFDIYTSEPLFRAFVYVDAHTGEVIRENLRIHHADVTINGETLYNGTVSITADNTGGTNHRLRQTTDGNGIRTFDLNNGTNYGAATDITDNGLPFNSDPTGVQAHWGAEQTHKYFLQNHSRNSYNGSGAIINSYVHYSNNYVNAFWDGQRMTYGDGDGVDYGPLVSLDIVGHEIAHGVTEYAANLVYSYQSGALNESFSDIFGESIENFALGNNDWLMGDDIGIGGSGAFRSMSNPNAFGDPDTYLGTYWYTGSGDNGGVHINSGVQNKWFYILSTGESGTNDNGDAYSVSGIGIEDAAKIAYRNLTVYLSANSVYFDARTGAIQAAQDLFGAGSPEEIATTNAWYAVGIGSPYGTLSYCSSQGNSVFYEWIADVTVGSFSNSSANESGGYSDFTSQVVSVDEGQSYNISLSPDFSGTIYNEYWKIWIDYNTDGDFTDSGELAFDAGGLSSTTVNGIINIPSGSSGTTTRMRVSMKWDASQSSCETFSYGEVEDYTIDIGGTAPGPLSVVISNSADISCNGADDGSATASASGGTPPYAYAWSNGGTTATITGLTPGSYTVTVTDGVSATDMTDVTINEPPALTVSPSGNDVSCGSTDNGSASANAGGGTSPYGYSWTGPGGFTSSAANISSLAAGSYDVTVTDANGCQDNGSVTITDPNSSFYADSDGDSYGDPGTEVRACSLPSGFVSDNTDCDDSNGNVNPGETEVCDGIDNNCDGTIDEGCGGCTLVEVDFNNFESGWGIWNDGGSDCRRNSRDKAYAIGNYCVRLRDNTGSSVMTTDNLDLSVYSSLSIDFSYYPRSMDNSNEDFWLQISNNGGSSYVQVEEWNLNDEFVNNTRYYDVVEIDAASILGGFTSNTRLRFRCDASGNNDWVYIDEVKISGCAGASSFAKAPVSKSAVIERQSVDTGPIPEPKLTIDSKVMDMRLFPNPVIGDLTIAYDLPQSKSAYLVVTDLTGKVLRREKLLAAKGEQRLQLDVSKMTNGFYFAHLVTDQGRLTRKFVVMN